MIIKKVFSIILKILLGLFVFYLFCALALIPLLTPLLIKSQGTKLLKTPVIVRGVYFNPFYLSLHVVGFEIKDKADRKVIGFDRLKVDVSFKDFFKKIVHVESVQLDGLFAHVSLMENGTIDLLSLVPTTSPAAASTPAAKSQAAQNPPLILIDKIILQKGSIKFDDWMVKPVFKTTLSQMELTITGFSTLPDSLTNIDFRTVLDEKGIVSAQAQLKPLKKPLEMELNLGLDQYAMTVVSPYVGKYTGRSLADGKMDFNTTYWISNNKIKAIHTLLIQHFDFGEKVESKDALNLPFGLAVALLEDPQGRIKISLPVEGDLSDPKFKYTPLIWQTVRNFFMTLVTKPFSVLGSMLGGDSGSDELGYVRFLPGKSELAPEEVKKLIILAKAMNERPKLLLEINGSYDLTSDWKAIKTEQFNKDYAALKKESTKDESGLLQSLYQRRFGIRQLWKLIKKFKTKDGYDYENLNGEIKRQLSEDAFPDKAALSQLAQDRAQVIYDVILKEHLDPRRVQIGINHEVQASMGFVPLEFVLTVFEESPSAVEAQ
jgi:hypothetical protein